MLLRSALEKHRDEVVTFNVSFRRRLRPGESLVSTPAPEIRVLDRSRSGVWDIDVTSQFGNPTVGVDDASVQFTLRNAAAGTQKPGMWYLVYLRVSTSLGDQLVAVLGLTVRGEGSNV
jgi:hypothetical protein